MAAKNIFVEVDHMPSHRLNAVTRDNVKAAFRNAPVGNPDGTSGINIHIEIDDSDDIAHQDSIRIAPDIGYWPGFDETKKNHFETASQHGNASVLKAKKIAYHYCLMAHNYGVLNYSSLCGSPNRRRRCTVVFIEVKFHY
jgi:hypothetical protein